MFMGLPGGKEEGWILADVLWVVFAMPWLSRGVVNDFSAKNESSLALTGLVWIRKSWGDIP